MKTYGRINENTASLISVARNCINLNETVECCHTPIPVFDGRRRRRECLNRIKQLAFYVEKCSAVPRIANLSGVIVKTVERKLQ